VRVGTLCALALVAAVASVGCGPKIVRQTVHETDASRVELRHLLEDGKPVARGYEHPATIAGVRLAHILASLARETGDGKHEPIVRNEQVYDLADGIAAAFAKAGPDDEIVVLAKLRDRRFGIFTVDRVTSFRVYQASGQLYFEFFAVEEQLDREAAQKGYEPPLEAPSREPGWRLVAGRALTPTGERTAAVDWRDDYWRQPISLRVRQGK
jgi:hypothetical protein